MSLQTGTELISLALVFNKATGVYGILTLFTGYSLSALQVSAYLGSLFVLATLCVCIPQIRKQSPLHNLALAWVYAIDTVVSAIYTTVFATSWYLSLIHGKTGGATADVANDDVTAVVDGSVADGDPMQHGSRQAVLSKPGGDGVQETAFSLVLVVGFTLIRVYFALVIMAYARMVLLRYVDERMNPDPTDEEDAGEGVSVSETSPNPFALGAPLGEGWKGKLGRAMVSIGKRYWLGGKKEDEEWAKQVHSRFRFRSTRE